jgi:anti-anti-sigma factor
VSIVAGVDGSDPAVVRLAGELDLATAPELSERLASIDGDVEVDCSRLEFVDAVGLTVFVRANQRLDEAGWKFVLVQPSPVFLRMLEITGLDASLEVRSDGAAPG